MLEWIFGRTENNDAIAVKTPIGYIPKPETFNLNGLDIKPEDFKELFRLDKDFLLQEVDELKQYYDDNVTESTPPEIYKQIEQLRERILKEM